MRYRQMRPDIARDVLLATHGGLSIELCAVIHHISPMAIYRLVCALGHHSLVAVLTRCELALPVYFLADEKHSRCLAEKVYLPTIFNLRGTAAFRRQGDRSGLTRAQCPSEAQSNKLCDPSMGEQNLLAKAASFRGQWFTLPRETARPAPVILLYDVLAVDVRGKPSIQSPWYCHSSDCPWGPLWCLKSLHPL